MSVLCGMLMFAIPGGEQKTPAPLSQDQIKQLRILVGGAQKKAQRIQSALQDKQQDLANLYAEFDLDVPKVKRLQREVLDLQRKLLENYHDMHVRLRSIVGRERYPMLQRRIQAVFGIGKKSKQKPRTQGGR